MRKIAIVLTLALIAPISPVQGLPFRPRDIGIVVW